MTQKAILIGLAGGTGSGKTSVAKKITADFSTKEVALIQQDSYYLDLAHKPMDERIKVNFDHPDSLDFDEMTEHVDALIYGGEVSVPVYDHSTHTRSTTNFETYQGIHIIVLEGIFALFDESLRKRMDIKIFVDTPDDVRIIRRIKRDMHERGRSFDSIIDQYYKTVRPMHNQFVEPTKRYADLIIPEGAYNKVAIDILRCKIQDLINQKSQGIKTRS